MIASGPCYPDTSTPQDALELVKKYNILLSQEALDAILLPTPKQLSNVTTHITGSVRQLCNTAALTAVELGYSPVILTDCLDCEARQAGKMLGAIAKSKYREHRNLAYIMGGETVVNVVGKGLGGRNQELSLAAAEYIADMDNAVVFSFGSDGTDGPTDAAGGLVDGKTKEILEKQGITIYSALSDNDAYHALQRADALVFTGPTGTNVNDLSMLLIKSDSN